MSSNIIPSDTPQSGGFLSGFIEASIEMPSDEMNGECIVHFGGDQSQYIMIVTIVNGVREGEAMIVNDGMPYLRLEYKQGSLTGDIERFNEYGVVDLRGRLVNGIENGLFKEYDNHSKVIWRGYYRNGKRYSGVRNQIVRKGEHSNEFYELDEHGRVTKLLLYVNRMKSRVLARFNDDTMTEYNENEKRVYEGGFKGDMKDGFVRDGIGKEYTNNGRAVVYSGDWKDGKREGLGTEFSDYRPVYTGEWKDGKRNGDGEEMDERGKVVRRGKWVNGYHESDMKRLCVAPSSLITSPLEIEEEKIEGEIYDDLNVAELKLTWLVQLKRIVIGEDCLVSVRLFELNRLSELESVVIRDRCFIHVRTPDDIYHSKRSDGACRIVNCPKLNSILIGYYSFLDYHSFELNTLPSLQSIDIGGWCFRWAISFSLISIID